MQPTYGLNVPKVQGRGAAIMVWGCLSTYGFHGLILLDGAVDAKGYVAVLQQYLLPAILPWPSMHLPAR
ncbi:hypothetical protein EON65_49865 [archaeon]|nr:MAG: hypothetical protein EON65_49865 [archaeon]